MVPSKYYPSTAHCLILFFSTVVIFTTFYCSPIITFSTHILAYVIIINPNLMIDNETFFIVAFLIIKVFFFVEWSKINVFYEHGWANCFYNAKLAIWQVDDQIVKIKCIFGVFILVFKNLFILFFLFFTTFLFSSFIQFVQSFSRLSIFISIEFISIFSVYFIFTISFASKSPVFIFTFSYHSF